MKTKSKAELKEIAKGIFARYKRAQNVAVTSDGTAFITDESDLAVKNHSVKNRYKRKLSITEFTREDVMTETKADDKPKAKTAKELIAEVEKATIKEAVEAILEAEQKREKDEKRKTVLEACTQKLETLKEAK